MSHSKGIMNQGLFIASLFVILTALIQMFKRRLHLMASENVPSVFWCRSQRLSQLPWLPVQKTRSIMRRPDSVWRSWLSTLNLSATPEVPTNVLHTCLSLHTLRHFRTHFFCIADMFDGLNYWFIPLSGNIFVMFLNFLVVLWGFKSNPPPKCTLNWLLVTN